MQLSGTLNHVEFFVDTASRYRTRIAHTHHDLPSQTVGKRHERFGNLSLTINSKFEFQDVGFFSAHGFEGST